MRSSGCSVIGCGGSLSCPRFSQAPPLARPLTRLPSPRTGVERLQAALEPGRFRQHHIPPRPFGDDLDPRHSPLQQVGSGWGPGTPCLRGAGNWVLGCIGLGRRAPSWPSCVAFLSNSCFARRSTWSLESLLSFHTFTYTPQVYREPTIYPCLRSASRTQICQH